MARQQRFGPHRYEFELGKRNYSFQADIDRIIINTEKRLQLVAQQSIITAINRMQLAVAKGGKMRVDTGFLRASGQSSLDGMPTGPSRKPKDAMPGQFQWTSKDTEIKLSELKLGSTFFFGWTAYYAKYREAYDGFMYSVVQDWQNIVNKVVENAKKRFS